MINKILKVLAALGAFFSAIFYVLFRQAKEEQKVINEKYDNMSENLNALKAGEKAEMEIKHENEKLKKAVHNSNNLDAFNACNDILSK